MAGNWLDPNQYPPQQPVAYQYPAPDYAQQAAMYQQSAAYNAAAYQQHYAQQYGAAQGYQQQAWVQAQYQQYPQQAGWNLGYPAQQQYQQNFQQPQYQPQQAPVSWPGNAKGVSCYNCGAKDHWATACPRPPRAAFGNIGPVTPAAPSAVAPAVQFSPQVPGGQKGPVVTKYAVPPHVAAQMKARGVQGVTAIEPNAPGPGYGAQYSGWQQWQGQVANPTTYQTHPGVQSPAYPQTFPQHGSHEQAPFSSAGNQPQPAGSPTESHPSYPVNDVSSAQSPLPTVQTADTPNHTEAEQEDQTEEDDEDDLALLDIPDMPCSYGTPAYVEPKLLAKPLYALAPEWTQAGFGEVTLCEDPAGRTISNYFKSNELDSVLKSHRTPAHDEDPIFATIDVDTPVREGRSGSRDSYKTGYETPSTFESAETLPTSIDDGDENFQQGQIRAAVLSKANKVKATLDNDHTCHPTEVDTSRVLQDKKRKHDVEEDELISNSNNNGTNAKKTRSEYQESESR